MNLDPNPSLALLLTGAVLRQASQQPVRPCRAVAEVLERVALGLAWNAES